MFMLEMYLGVYILEDAIFHTFVMFSIFSILFMKMSYFFNCLQYIDSWVTFSYCDDMLYDKTDKKIVMLICMEYFNLML